MATVGTVFAAAEPIEQCRVAIRPASVSAVAEILWSSILSDHLSADQAPACQLSVNVGSTEGLSHLRMRSTDDAVTCRLTLVNPSDSPLVVQPILLDDLLPGSMNYSDMVVQLPVLSDKLFRAAHVPKHLTKFPQVRTESLSLSYLSFRFFQLPSAFCHFVASLPTHWALCDSVRR